MNDAISDSYTAPPHLQKLAQERIRFFLRELKENYGIEVKAGMELEFTLWNKQGNPINNSYIFGSDQWPYFARTVFVERFYHEGSRQGNKWECVVGKHATDYNTPLDDHKRRKGSFLPTHVVPAVVNGMKRLLRNSAPNYQIHRLSFDANPPLDTDTAGLHTNVSLWHGNQLLFARSDNFMGYEESFLFHHCAEALLDLQKDGVLAFAPVENSYERFGAHSDTPRRFECQYKKSNGGSVQIRTAEEQSSLTYDPEQFRLENRLSGADADPYVSMAVTLAALYHAVKTNVTSLKDGESPPDKRDEIIHAGDKRLGVKYHDGFMATRGRIPDTLEESIENFRNSKLLPELLGQEFCDAIVQQYEKSLEKPGVANAASFWTGRAGSRQNDSDGIIP